MSDETYTVSITIDNKSTTNADIETGTIAPGGWTVPPPATIEPKGTAEAVAKGPGPGGVVGDPAFTITSVGIVGKATVSVNFVSGTPAEFTVDDNMSGRNVTETHDQAGTELTATVTIEDS